MEQQSKKGKKGKGRKFDPETELKEVYRDPKWFIEIPMTHEVSQHRYERHTSWCTATKNSPGHFNRYKDRGELYVIRKAERPSKELYQLFIDKDLINTEFQDKNNHNRSYLDTFFEENPIIHEFFKNVIGLKESTVMTICGRQLQYSIDEETGIYTFDKIHLADVGLNEIPKKLRDLGEYHVTGDFDIHDNELTSLEGCPTTIGGDFNVSKNKLKNLKGSPETVGGTFDCSGNQMESLEGIPPKVGSLKAFENNLTNLNNISEIIEKDLDVHLNKITGFSKDMKFVGGDIKIYANRLESLEHCPEIKGRLFVFDNAEKFPPESKPAGIAENNFVGDPKR